MVNTQFKFEAEIPIIQKLSHSQKLHKISKFQGQFKVKVTSFQTHLNHLDAQ